MKTIQFALQVSLILLLGGFAGANPASSTVWVSKPDGSKQCQQEGIVALTAMQKELTEAGIKVLGMKKENDGKMHMQMCGADTGALNVFEISVADLKKAEELKFQQFNKE